MTSETFQQPLLQVAQLSVSFPSPQGLIEAVNALSFDVHAGEVLALVGESGSGKSVTARTLVGLAGAGAAVRAESLILHGHVEVANGENNTFGSVCYLLLYFITNYHVYSF